MRLGITFTSLFAGLMCLTFVEAATHDGDKSSREDAAQLLKESTELRSITTSGSQPFHLIANVHLAEPDRVSDGTYEILWEKPDRFRVAYSFPWYRETDFFLGDKAYLLRPASYVPLIIWKLRALLNLGLPGPSRPKPPADPFAGFEKEAFREKKGTQMNCVKVRRKEACLDAATKDLLSMHFGRAPRSDKYEFSDYVPFGFKRIPRTMSLRLGGDFRVDVHVEGLVPAAAFAGDTFVPPSNAKIREWCTDPEFSGSVSGPPFLVQSPSGSVAPRGYLAVQLEIGADGHVKEIYLLRSLIPGLEQNVLDSLSRKIFPIETCNNKPIEREMILEMDRE